MKGSLIETISTYVKLTFNSEGKVSLYDATTDSKESLIWMYFQKIIEKAETVEIKSDLLDFLSKVPKIYILKAGLILVRHVVSYYFFKEKEAMT